MTISPINGSLALLASAVKPVTATTDTPAQAAGLTGSAQLNTFALSVLAQTLESQESLLNSSGNGQSNQANANDIVQAGVSGAAVVAAKYQATQSLDVAALTPSVNIKV